MRNTSVSLASVLAALAGHTDLVHSSGFLNAGAKVFRDTSPNMPKHVVGYATMLPEQRFNPERAAQRRRTKAMGGRRQYLRTTKTLRRLKAQLATVGSAA